PAIRAHDVMTLNLCIEGDSCVHRAPAGVKMLGLAIAATAMMMVQEWWIAGLCLAAVMGLCLLARIPPMLAMAQMQPVLWLIAIVGLTQAVSGEAILGLVVAL